MLLNIKIKKSSSALLHLITSSPSLNRYFADVPYFKGEATSIYFTP